MTQEINNFFGFPETNLQPESTSWRGTTVHICARKNNNNTYSNFVVVSYGTSVDHICGLLKRSPTRI